MVITPSPMSVRTGSHASRSKTARSIPPRKNPFSRSPRTGRTPPVMRQGHSPSVPMDFFTFRPVTTPIPSPNQRPRLKRTRRNAMPNGPHRTVTTCAAKSLESKSTPTEPTPSPMEIFSNPALRKPVRKSSRWVCAIPIAFP